MEETQQTIDEGAHTTGTFKPVHEEAPPEKSRDLTKLILGLIVVLLIGVLVLQSMQLQRVDDVTAEVAALTEDVTDLKPLIRDVDILTNEVAALEGEVAAAGESSSSAVVPAATPDGNLPTFQSSTNDPAVIAELALSTITGPEYYSDTEVTYTADDGKARVWLIWAHWCPYCQAELPELQAWWPANSDRFPNVELITVTSAIDDTRSNPLLPYLDSEQFDFPVVVDDTGDISQKFGTSAFPFWVVTDSDGTVVLRVAGAIGSEAVDQIFTQLESMQGEA